MRLLGRVSGGFAPLAEPQYRLLWAGQAVSVAGDSLVPVALAFAVLRLGGGAAGLGAVLASSTAARLVFLLLGGVWADRLPRQVLMLASDGGRAAASGAIAALLLTGSARLWHLAAGAVAFGIAGAFFQPASTALVPQTVKASMLQQANALMGLSRSVCDMAGPAVAGVLVAVYNPGIVYAIDSASFVVSAASLAVLKVAPIETAPSRSFLGDLAAGWRELAIRPWYWLNLCSHAAWNFAITALFVLGPVVCATRLGGPRGWGVLSGALGAGSVAGGLIALRALPRRPLVAGNLALTAAALPLVALAGPLPLALVAAAMAAAFAGLTLLNEVWSATMQQLIPAAVMARVSAYDWMVSLIAMPAGYAVVGPAAAWLGLKPVLLVAAALVALPSALIVLVPGVRGVRRLDDGTIAAAALPGRAD